MGSPSTYASDGITQASSDRARRVQGLRRTLGLCAIGAAMPAKRRPPDAFLFVGVITNSLQTDFSDLTHRVAGMGLLQALNPLSAVHMY